jgi:hypothetical protein
MNNNIPCRKKPKALQNAHTLKGTWSAALCCKPHRSMFYTRDLQVIRLAVRFLHALHLDIFEQPQTKDYSLIFCSCFLAG